MLGFTQKKFLSLPLGRQHKNLAELLRQAYEGLIANRPVDDLLHHYNEIITWMEHSPLYNCQDRKYIADRYHWHLGLARVHFREHNLLPEVEQGDKRHSSPPLPISIYLDNLRSAHNIGSILRTTEALSLGSVYFSKDTPFTDNAKVKKTSMGAWEWISCFKGVELKHLPKPVIVLETSPDAFNLHEFVFPESFTLVVGNEEYGCSDSSLHEADYLLRIPLMGRKNSLNVANAFSIAAGAIQRQQHLHVNER